MEDIKRYGWAGRIDSFLELKENELMSSLKRQHDQYLNLPVDESQLLAWNNCFSSITQTLNSLITTLPDAATWHIIFEYALHRERGRRPDVLILAPEQIFVLEYKDYSIALRAHIDQVAAYARDIANYHGKSQDNPVIPILVINKGYEIDYEENQVYILSPEKLSEKILSFFILEKYQKIDFENWINAEYQPLPTLVAAARDIFNHEPLPNIRKAQSAGIPETISELNQIASEASDNNEHHLALITGVPGSGKTLVGLQFVYLSHLNGLRGRPAIFLSGNGPLVKVLQHALRSSVFVQDVHGFLMEYGGGHQSTPEETIFVYDEAQRAWDENRVSERRGKAISEPEDFLQIGERKPWSLMVGLIGEGQEIHLGEESGLDQWNEAIVKMNKMWIVHCPKKVATKFPAAAEIRTSEHLNLTITLRSHLADHLQDWVASLLDNKISEAGESAKSVFDDRFNIYLTRDIEKAKEYVSKRYHGELDKRYGILASSKARNLGVLGIHNEYQYTQNLREGPWYNDPPDSRFSCCQLNDVATEFSCQGLELDFPIVCWGDDVYWDSSGQLAVIPQIRSRAVDPRQLRINSYRVLLTRGRDGFIIFVPNAPNMDMTYSILKKAGAQELPR